VLVKLSLAIVVADDEVDMRDFYSRILAFLGHRVIAVATTGRELVELCRLQLPELIITDITMPEMNGDEAVAEICRESPIPVIVVTALDDAGRHARSRNEHVTAYLVKPIGRKDLEKSIPLAMRRFDGHRQLFLEAGDGKHASVDRQMLEQAAARLANDEGIDECDAYVRMQSAAAESKRRLADVARSALNSE
jgi:response regulator NasT